ncbi:MAG TPA: PAS domain-containing protein, partial [Puia sp.]|nr:PAS domain-containing protein [Puia sp.]
MDIAPDGVILSTCARFAALLKRRNIHDFLGSSLLDIFPRLGKTDPVLTPDLLENGLPPYIDLSVKGQSSKPVTIRWIPTPKYALDFQGWQLTGPRLYADPFPESGDRRRTTSEDMPVPANLIKQVSDIIITTDLEDRIVYWNIAAEKFYDIPAPLAIGQSLRELLHYDYLNTT